MHGENTQALGKRQSFFFFLCPEMFSSTMDELLSCVLYTETDVQVQVASLVINSVVYLERL